MTCSNVLQIVSSLLGLSLGVNLIWAFWIWKLTRGA